MPAGRPPTYDVLEQAKALDDWSKKDDATALVQFCNQQDVWADIIYEWRDRSPEFALALKKAKTRIAARLRSRLHDKDKPYNYGLFMSELGFHDKFYHDYIEGLKDKEAARKKDIENSKQSTYNIMVPNDLAIGSNIPASPISDKSNKSS